MLTQEATAHCTAAAHCGQALVCNRFYTGWVNKVQATADCKYENIQTRHDESTGGSSLNHGRTFLPIFPTFCSIPLAGKFVCKCNPHSTVIQDFYVKHHSATKSVSGKVIIKIRPVLLVAGFNIIDFGAPSKAGSQGTISCFSFFWYLSTFC